MAADFLYDDGDPIEAAEQAAQGWVEQVATEHDAMAIVNGGPTREDLDSMIGRLEDMLRDAVRRERLPLTCASPEAHLAQVRRSKPLWWLRAIGLLGDGKPPVDCPVCWKPLPKSHRRNG